MYFAGFRVWVSGLGFGLLGPFQDFVAQGFWGFEA